ATSGDDHAGAGEASVSGHNGIAIDAQVLGEHAHGRERPPGYQSAALDEGAHTVDDLGSGPAADRRVAVRRHPMKSRRQGPGSWPRGSPPAEERHAPCYFLT